MLVVAILLALASQMTCAAETPGEIKLGRPSLPPCTPELSVAAPVMEVSQPDKPYQDQCVKLQGLWIGDTLYSDLDAYYLDLGQWSPLTIEGALKHEPPGHVALAVSDRLRRDRRRSGAVVRADVIGRMDSCDNARDDPNGILLMCIIGSADIFVGVDKADFEPIVVHRLTSPQDRVRVGNLAIADAGSPDQRSVQQLAETWSRAVADGDAQALAGLYTAGDSDRDRSEIRTAVRALLRDHALRRQLASAGPAPEVAALLYKRPGEASSDRAADRMDAGAIACICLTTSCAALWPIIDREAAQTKGRPYHCVELDHTADAAPVSDLPWTIHLGWTLNPVPDDSALPED